MTPEQIDDEVQMIITAAQNAVAFEPADAATLGVFTSLLATAMWQLKDSKLISDYSVDTCITDDNKMSGTVMYRPTQATNVVVNISVDGDSKAFDRAMKGI